ncbi:MAG: IS1595 family transposase [Bryobacteraceae bacterium]|jgi:transposase-like protein
MASEPTTLQEAVVYFSDPDNCLNYLVARRWPNGVTCPTCGSAHVGFLANQRRWQCSSRHPKRQFSVKVGTIFEDSPLGLEKWLPCVWLLTNCKNGVSSWEIHRDLGVTQKTAWFMLHRVRLAMQDESFGGKIGGEVEVDETFIGGKARNMHKSRKLRQAQSSSGRGMQGGAGKAIVMGMLERGKTVRTAVIEERTKAVMQPIIRENVEPGAEVFSDEWASNWRMDDEYSHNVINHLQSYVDGNIHTNGMENFWSLLKRGIHGTYVSVEPFHLFRYVDEQAFRYNNRRPMNDADRFSYVIRKIVGKRLTYAELTGKTEEGTTPAEEIPF